MISDQVYDTLSVIGKEENTSSQDIEATGSTSSGPSDKASQLPIRLTDLLLEGSAAKSVQKHGGTGVDEFMREIPIQRRRARGKRRRQFELPAKYKQTMGHANILWARGEIEEAKAICMELIRQGKLIASFSAVGGILVVSNTVCGHVHMHLSKIKRTGTVYTKH